MNLTGLALNMKEIERLTDVLIDEFQIKQTVLNTCQDAVRGYPKSCCCKRNVLIDGGAGCRSANKRY